MKSIWAISTRPRIIFGHFKPGKKLFRVYSKSIWKIEKKKKRKFCIVAFLRNLSKLLKSSKKTKAGDKFCNILSNYFFYEMVLRILSQNTLTRNKGKLLL